MQTLSANVLKQLGLLRASEHGGGSRRWLTPLLTDSPFQQHSHELCACRKVQTTIMSSVFPAVFYALNGRHPGQSPNPSGNFDITPKTSCSGASVRALEKELVGAIQNSVRKCTRTAGQVFLSLSAGYDSTAILGAFASQSRRVSTFTYGLAHPPRWSDVAVARETAQRLDFPHEIWPMDQYPVEIIQQENSRLFGFRANRCGELGAWLHFRDKIAPTLDERPLFVFGDECFGWNDCNIRTDEDLLHSLAIVTHTELIEPFLSPSVIEPLRDAYNNELARIVRRTEHLDDPHDKKDYLYFHERIQNVILPWRQQFASVFGDVALPLLDDSILGLVGQFPSKERRGKHLMKRAVRAAYPEAFAFRRAVRSGTPALPLLSAWPEHYARTQLLDACEQIGFSVHIVDEIERRTSTLHRKSDTKSVSQEIKAIGKAWLKDTAIANAARSLLPPPFAHPSIELILSRMQIWLLGFLKQRCVEETST